jgi:DNA-binding GntR family transcriptional regulator
MKEPLGAKTRTTLPRAPLYARIADDLRTRIAGGLLPDGFRVASSRTLARQLGVSRNSVIAAYELLTAEGLLESRHGSGTRVRVAPKFRIDPRQLLRAAQYPSVSVSIEDPDGHCLRLHR